MLFDNYCNFFSNSIFIFLLVSTVFYWFSLRFTKVGFYYKFAKINSRVATVILFIFLSNRWIQNGYFPLSNLYESLLFLSCILLFVYQFIEYKTNSKIFGAIILPLVLFITGFADLTLPLEMRKASALVPALQSNWLMMHVSLMMLSYAILIIGSLVSILFLIIFLSLSKDSEISFTSYSNYEEYARAENIEIRDLYSLFLDPLDKMSASRQKKVRESRKLEFLYNLDNWGYRTISLGFPFLTIGIIAGAVWANEAWGSYWSWDPKETWALITWLIFAAYLHLRLIKGWVGKGPAILASIGFFVVWICYLGVNFLGQGLHSYGWLT